MPADAPTDRTGPRSALAEPSRLAAVRATGLLGSAAAASWDRLTGLAAQLLEAPMAFMTIADDKQSYWLSCSGLDLSGPADRDHPVGDSFCQYVIADRAPSPRSVARTTACSASPGWRWSSSPPRRWRTSLRSS